MHVPAFQTLCDQSGVVGKNVKVDGDRNGCCISFNLSTIGVRACGQYLYASTPLLILWFSEYREVQANVWINI